MGRIRSPGSGSVPTGPLPSTSVSTLKPTGLGDQGGGGVKSPPSPPPPVNVVAAISASVSIAVVFLLAFTYWAKTRRFDATRTCCDNTEEAAEACENELCDGITNIYERSTTCRLICYAPCFLAFILLWAFGYGFGLSLGYFPFLLVYFCIHNSCCPARDARHLRDSPPARATQRRAEHSAVQMSRPRIPQMHMNEDDQPPLKWQMLQFVDVHLCGYCSADDLAVRRQSDGGVRVRCRACGEYVGTAGVRRWFEEEGPTPSEQSASSEEEAAVR